MKTIDENPIGRYAKSKKSGQLFKVVGYTSLRIFMQSVEMHKNPGYRETLRERFDRYYEWVDK